MKTIKKALLKKVFLCFLTCYSSLIFSQIGIGTEEPSNQSSLDIRSTEKGLLIPRLTTTERTTFGTALSTANNSNNKGMQVFDTETNSIWFWNGTSWYEIADKTRIATSFNPVLDNTIDNAASITAIGRYIVPATGLSGAFVGHANKYADYNGTSFTFTTPPNGDRTMVLSGVNTGLIYSFNGTTWVKVDNYTASNGLTAAAGNLKLGGAITEATTISELTATNKLAITGVGVDAINLDSNTLSINATDNRIGIGTAAPAVKLDLHGSTITVAVATEEVLRLNRPVLIGVKNQVSAGIKIGSFETGIDGRGRMDFMVSGTPTLNGNGYGSVPDMNVMTLLGNGTVGIGTATPAATLDVNGTIKISGGTPGAGKVLTSDPNGLAIWASGTLQSGITSTSGQEVITSFDGALSIKASTTITGRLDARSNVGGIWSGGYTGTGNTYGFPNDAITLVNANISNWTQVIGGDWVTVGGIQTLVVHNQSSGKVYRVTRVISPSYASCPVIIEILR